VCELNTLTRTQSFAYPLFVLTLIVILDDDRERGSARDAAADRLPVVIICTAPVLAALIAVAHAWAAARNRARPSVGDGCRPMLAPCLPLAVFQHRTGSRS
jgi:hypothetical protein